MSENRTQKEPSTEEILGSIRRIITEDNAQAGTANAGRTARTAATELPVLTDDVEIDDVEIDDVEIDDVEIDQESMAEDLTAEISTVDEAPADMAPVDVASDEMTAGDEEILELTDEIADEEPVPDVSPMMDDEPEEIRREPRFGLSATPSDDTDAGEDNDIRREPMIGVHADETPPAEPPPQDNAGWAGATAEPLAGYNYSAQVLSSNQDTVEDSQDTAGQDDLAGQEAYTMAPTTDGEPEAPETSPIEETSQPAPDFGDVHADIVSQAATTATAAALGDLNRAVSEKTDKLKLGGEATVADIVKEMLRPMLREWLDENLPLIVDRVVRREIQKLVDRTQDDD